MQEGDCRVVVDGVEYDGNEDDDVGGYLFPSTTCCITFAGAVYLVYPAVSLIRSQRLMIFPLKARGIRSTCEKLFVKGDSCLVHHLSTDRGTSVSARVCCMYVGT